jgi:dUTP pyrophosphatase
MVKVKIQRAHADAILPCYANFGDAGLDLFSCEGAIIKAGEQALIATGVKMAIPTGYVGLIWDKSGLAAKSHVKTMAGVIDSGYRGEVKVVLRNHAKTDFKVEKNTKIAQMLIQPIVSAEIEEAHELDSTERGAGGFGSTGVSVKTPTTA